MMKLPFIKYILVSAGVLTVVALMGWRISDLKWDKAREELNYQIQVNKGLELTLEVEREALKAMDAENKRIREEVKLELDKINSDRADVANGDSVVRVEANCPEVPRTTASAPMDNGARPELTGQAGQNYFRLREEITHTVAQIEMLQSYIKDQCMNK